MLRQVLIAHLWWLFAALCAPAVILGEDHGPRRLLLLSQGPDGHPPGTHEYVAGQRILSACLANVPGLKIEHARADGEWAEGPRLLSEADGVVLFVSEGAKWLNSDPARRAAFAELAERGGALSVIHWGMGAKDAAHIDPFVSLFGACHGGPDRKFKVLEADVSVPSDHPATAGLDAFRVKEEFYYRLKRQPEAEGFVPLLSARIDDRDEMVGWAWQRPGGGRSFGFTGCHYHENWSRPEYQRFISQAVLWTLDIAPPSSGFPATVDPSLLKLE
jgi:hypothetical protein